jgi:DMSO/TMAO reductase YedYZ molybdopterin-dependent catalytic subunit
MQDSERLKTSEVNEAQADDPELLLALEVGGEVLHADHGFPARLIGPNRPGVQQTKWVARIEVA